MKTDTEKVEKNQVKSSGGLVKLWVNSQLRNFQTLLDH